MTITETLDKLFYPDATRIWDDERFVEIIKQQVCPKCRVLDFGAGRGKNRIFDFRRLAKGVIGADIDEAVFENPFLDERILIHPGKPFDLESESVDLAYCCNVLEHLSEPEFAFQEIARVLKPGGLFLAKTTNTNHYISLAARLTPLCFHKAYNRIRGREAIDTFPTVYKCNSKRQLTRAMRKTTFRVEQVEFWEGRPEYLRISPLTYVVGIAYERIANSTRLFEPFRAVMFVALRKAA